MDSVNITLPKSWQELSQKELRQFFSFSSALAFSSKSPAVATASVITHCALKWAGLKPVCPYGDGWLIRHDGREIVLTAAQLAKAVVALDFLRHIPDFPVRLDTVDGSTSPFPVDLSEGFTFDLYLAADSLYQQYVSTVSNPEAYESAQTIIRSLATILFDNPEIDPSPGERLSVFYWWASFKSYVSGMFPNFLKPAPADGSSGANSPDDMRRSVDAQIRALTKGDVTKEKQVLDLPVLRALTELDALAREYDELRKKYPSIK